MGKIRANMQNLTFQDEVLEFVDMYDFPVELIESVCWHPEEVTIDHTDQERDYLVLRFRRGDITVVIGLLDPNSPRALYVYLNTPDGHVQNSSAPKKASGGSGSTSPKSVNGLLSWAQKNGFSIVRSNSGHTKVYMDERLVATVSGTPSDRRSIPNTFAVLKRHLAVSEAKRYLTKEDE